MGKDKKIVALPTADVTPASASDEKSEPKLPTLSEAAAEPASPTLPSDSALPEFKPGEYKGGLPPPIPSATFGPVAAPQEGAQRQAPPGRRSARRRAAGPARTKLAANDDAPSIGGLIYALDQKPGTKPFHYAAIASAVWAVIGLTYTYLLVSAEMGTGAGFTDVLARPQTFLTLAAIVVPIAVLYFLALLAWRSDELRLRSSTMTEVAVRLAEPDRMAEQSVASLGQAVRRQVSFMNDAVSRALGRASELEALVHNEVSALERSYEDNERKIRGLIGELAGERDALLNTSRDVTDTLKSLGTDVPGLIEKLSHQQIKLAQIIQGAGENLTTLETAVSQSAGRLEDALGSRTSEMQAMLESYTAGLAYALESRTQQFHDVFEEFGRALDTSVANRAASLDAALVQRTAALDESFNERLRLFDESIMRSTLAIDRAVNDRSAALTTALDNHARVFSDTISRQSSEIDETLMQGINTVRRSSENITRQSLKAIEGLAGQSEMLRNISENLLGQIHSVTNRFESQGQSIMKAANALEGVNYKIDATLQNRHADLAMTLDRISGKADELGRFVHGYSSSIEGSISEAEQKARAMAEQLKIGTEATRRSALEDIERLRREADAEGERALEDLRRRFANVSNAMTEQLTSLSTRVDQTSDDVRRRAQRAAHEIAAEQERLREQLEHMPATARQTTETMRRALSDQMKALEQLSSLTSRTVRDIYPPPPPAAPGQIFHPADASPRRAPGVAPPLPALPRPTHAQVPDVREAWSLGDLLARASRDEDGHGSGSSGGEARQGGYQLNVDIISRALDPPTAQALWARIRTGQRGVMVRSIYSTEGRLVFDEVSRRYRTDFDLKHTVDRYLADFERMRTEADSRDPSGRSTEGQMLSDSGRVYLFLAHAAGRL